MGLGGAARWSTEIRLMHNDALFRVAKFLETKGFIVKANHVDWEAGPPESYGGVVPDLEAVYGRKRYFFEIETCESFADELATKSKLSVLAADTGHRTCAIMFLNCRRGDKSFNGCRALEKAVLRWGLAGRVEVACYDTFSHRLYLNPEITGEEEAPAV